MSTLRSLVVRFCAYRALAAEGFVYPIITIYALSRGLNLADVGLATGSFFLGTLVGEIPTGYVGDRIGRRNGLIVGAVLVAATHLGFAFADSTTAFVLIYAFWGVAATFRSGTADAWLYDTLAERGATERYTRVRGRATSAFYVSAATTALVGGLLYEFHHSYPFFATAGLSIAAGVVVATLPEPGVSEGVDGFSLAETRTALATIVSNRQLGAFVLLSGVVLAVPETVEVFVQPVATTLGFRPTTLGPLYAGLMVAAAAGSSVAPSVKRWFGTARWFTVGSILFVCVLLLAVPLPLVAVPTFFVSRGFNTATTTLGSTFLNDRITATGRATTLSGVSMAYALLFFCGRSTGGAIAAATSPLVAIAVVGCVAVVSLLAVRSIADPFADAVGSEDGGDDTGVST